MDRRHLAQINIATLRAPEGDPQVAEFFANLDRINALAESSDGFVWRLTDEDGANATGIAVEGTRDTIVNMSVWRDLEALRTFVYRSAHSEMIAKRREWFVPADDAFQALWLLEPGTEPRPEQGMARLKHLQRHGPSEHAFTFASAKQFCG